MKPSALHSFVGLTIPSLFAFALLAEGFLRLAIPVSGTPLTRQDPGPEGIYTFDVDGPRDGLTSRGPLGRHARRWHVNNAGWLSDVDYFPRTARRRALIAIVGDSYIEARQVNPEDSVAAVLRRELGDRCDVYSFGMGGAPLSQYLLCSRYVRRVYQPDLLVVNVVHNDFDESLVAVTRSAAFAQLAEAGDSFDLVPPKRQRSGWRHWVGRPLLHTALFRYVYLNLRGQQAIDSSTPVAAPLPAIRPVATRAADFVVQRLAEENPPTAVVFMIDGPRADLYGGPARFRDTTWMNEALRKSCARRGVPLLDLTQAFVDQYRTTGEKLNDDDDYHWNETGHRVAARALTGFLRTRHLLPGEAGGAMGSR